MRRRVSTASGSERGYNGGLFTGATLATARGTDSARVVETFSQRGFDDAKNTLLNDPGPGVRLLSPSSSGSRRPGPFQDTAPTKLATGRGRATVNMSLLLARRWRFRRRIPVSRFMVITQSE